MTKEQIKVVLHAAKTGQCSCMKPRMVDILEGPIEDFFNMIKHPDTCFFNDPVYHFKTR